MKFIFSFLLVSTILSADNCYKLSLGNAALTNDKLCAPVNIFTPATPVKCDSPTLQLPTQTTIKCPDLPVTPVAPLPAVSAKCTPAQVICPPVQSPVIECPKTPLPPNQCPPPANCATPEPASYALLGAGLMTAGLARKFGKK